CNNVGTCPCRWLCRPCRVMASRSRRKSSRTSPTFALLFFIAITIALYSVCIVVLIRTHALKTDFLSGIPGGRAGNAKSSMQHGAARIEYDGLSYDTFTTEPQADLRLVLEDDHQNRVGSFDNLERYLSREGRKLVFAMNAGMFDINRDPVGLYIQDSK